VIDVPTMGGLMDDYLSTSETAKRLGVTRSTLMGWIYRGKIRFSRRGRWYFLHVVEVDRVAELMRLAA